MEIKKDSALTFRELIDWQMMVITREATLYMSCYSLCIYLFIYFFNFIDSWICQLSCAINLSSWHCNILPQRLVFHCCYFGKDHLNRGSLFISLRRTSTDEGGRGIINAGEGFNIDHYQNDNSILVFPRQVSYTRTYSRTWRQGCVFSEKGLH